MNDISSVITLVQTANRLRLENARLIRELHIVRGMLAEGRNAGHSIRAAAREAEDYIGMLLDDDNMQDGEA